MTAKAKLSRMGKGKGKLKGWIGFARPGTLLYETALPSPRIMGKHPSAQVRYGGKFAFEKIRHKLPFGVSVVRRAFRARRSALSAFWVGYRGTPYPIPYGAPREGMKRYPLSLQPRRYPRTPRLLSPPRGRRCLTPTPIGAKAPASSGVAYLELL
jgi:hypothetical protein